MRRTPADRRAIPSAGGRGPADHRGFADTPSRVRVLSTRPGSSPTNRCSGWRLVTDAVRRPAARFRAALACRPGVPRLASAPTAAPGRALGDPRQRRDVSGRRFCLSVRAPRARDGRAAGYRQRLRAGGETPRAPASTASKSTPRMAICLTSSSAIPATSAPTSTAAPIENRAAADAGGHRRHACHAAAGESASAFRPVGPANDIADSDPPALFGYLVEQVARRELAYIHVVEGATGGPRDYAPFDYAALRRSFGGAYIANNGSTATWRWRRWKPAPPMVAFGRRSSPIPTLSSGCGRRRAADRTRQDHPLSRRRPRLHRLSQCWGSHFFFVARAPR